MTFQPTSEQQDAVALFRSGVNMAIEAGAGTGKTSTLTLLAQASGGRKGQYIAFNKAIVTEAGDKMPGYVNCATAHSLAFRSVGRGYAHRLKTPRMKSMDIARMLRIDPLVIRYGQQSKSMASGYLAGLVMRSVAKFCQSADPEPTERHVPYIDGIDVPALDGARTYGNNDVVRAHILPAVRRAWADLCDRKGQLPYKHDHYLKLWQLSDPYVDADFILFDECQDANPVMLDIVLRQTHAQLVFVGDSCQPAGTLVDVVVDPGAGGRPPVLEQRPIETVRAGDTVVAYDIAGANLRERGKPVLGVSERPFHGDLVGVKCGAFATRYTPDHHCVVRIGDGFTDKHLVYVMRSGRRFRVGRASGVYPTQSNGFGPMIRAGHENADALWVLSAHDSAEEAAVAEALASYRFGVPMMLFRAAAGRLVSQPAIERFWDAVGDLTDQARALLVAHGRDLRFPLWSASEGRLLVRRTATMRACNVMDGMQMLAMDSGWQPVSVSRERYDGPVYSMTVADLHTYVGDGVVTHNCQQIYSFTGAVNALDRIRDTGASTCYLTRSFRFGAAIADVANNLLERLGADLRLTGSPDIASVVAAVPEPDCILTRTNAVSVQTVLEQLAAGRKVALVGGGREVLDFARAADDLKNGRWTSHPELACFQTWGEVQEYVEQDAQGGDLRLLVNLVDEFGVEKIVAALGHNCVESDADVVVSTAHKAKGREWGSVQIAGDFKAPKDGGELEHEELRLLYVAVTRARRELDVTLVPHATESPEDDIDDVALPGFAVADDLSALEMTSRYGTRQAPPA